MSYYGTPEAFDRWLAQHDREVAERAWAEGITSVPDSISSITVEADGSICIDGYKQDGFRNPYVEEL